MAGSGGGSRRDFYAVLGVAQDASEDEIKRAFRQQALLHHPDQSGARGADMFHEIQEAYSVLRDASKRRQYDAMLRGGWAGDGVAGEHYAGPWGQPGVDSRDFDAAFDAWFKRTMERRAEFWFSESMNDWEEARVDAERRAAQRRAKAAAWELEKEEAKANRMRTERLRRRADDARAVRHAGILRGFWHTHHGITRMDAAFIALVLASAAGLALVWKAHLGGGRAGAVEREAVAAAAEAAPPAGS